MRILITNDDGINAPGLAVLEAIAKEIAGPKGEVWIAAPAFEQSGVGHKISYTHPFMISEFGPRRFAVEGAPADCVLAGVHYLLKDTPPDLILSGVNRGNNAAENVLYSGTIGGAMEGALQGIKSVAFSQFNGPANLTLSNPFEAAAAFGVETLRKILAADVWEQDSPYPIFYNVNFPPVPAAQVKGIRLGPQGMRQGARFKIEPQVSPSGRNFLWIKGPRQDLPSAPDCDTDLNMQGYVAVTPLRADLTAQSAMTALKDHFV